MQTLTIESALGQKLDAMGGQVVVCDEGGRVLGLFSPIQNRPRLEDLQLEPLLSIAETEELRKKNRTGKPLEEIFRRLGL